MALTPRVRVVVADDTADVCYLLRYTLDLDGRFEVVGQAGDGVEAVRTCQAKTPDAIVLDLAMPVMSGLEAIPLIRQVSPGTRIVVLSAFDAGRMEQDALDRGAHAYLEKGASFTDLTNLLAQLCTGEPDVMRAASTPSPTPVDAALYGLTQLEDQPFGPVDTTSAGGSAVGRVFRRARWVGAAFALLQFMLYAPPEDVQVPFSRPVAAGAIAAVLVAINLLSLVVTRRCRAQELPGWLSPMELVLDSSAVMALVWLFAFDEVSALWALLVIPVLEAAFRFGMRGAMTTWAALSAVYVVREVWAAGAYVSRDFKPDSLTYRLGIVLIVSMATGHLAGSFRRLAANHAVARREAERRAALLRRLAGASRRLAALSADELLAAVVDAGLDLGFDGAELCLYDEAAGVWRSLHRRGLPPEYGTAALPIEAGVAGAVRRRQESVLVEDYSSWLGALPEVSGAGFRSTVGTPIRVGRELVATLIVGTKTVRRITAHEIECLELLAAQAGVALRNARLLERIRHQALHDALTGLPNQLLFEDRVAQALAQAPRTGGRVAVLFLDLDRFKRVNDTLGHDFGNELLKQVAGRLLGAVRACDTVARMGGDEFTLLLPSLSRDEDAETVAAKVLEVFSIPFAVGRHELFVTASIGIAMYPEDGSRYESLLKHADTAMYAVKARGGNGHAVSGGRVETGSYPQLALEADLHKALAAEELRLVYQPIIDLRSGAVTGVEALVRWDHSVLGALEPDEFLPLADEATLLAAIDTWVLRTACSQLRAWQDAGLPTLRLAVNLSARHLVLPDLCSRVLDALRQAAVDPSLLDLEVTEQVALAEGVDVAAALGQLRAEGVRVALDDFGTGYSTLSRLRDFPVDTLKIDRSFVAEITTPDDRAPIVAATIALARSLGLEVVAEGVETSVQLAYLERHACHYAQGHLVSPPVAPGQISALVAARSVSGVG